MSARTTLKLNRAICDRARLVADTAGYSSLEEFVEHAIEKELAIRTGELAPEAGAELERRLKGLGYIG